MNRELIKKQIIQLMDVASEMQLEAALEILHPSSSKYSCAELQAFNARFMAMKGAPNKGLVPEEVFKNIRERFKSSHG